MSFSRITHHASRIPMWSTNSHKIAAAFAGLGFRVVINETEIIELNQWRNLRFEVSDNSLTNPHLPHRDDLYRGWMENTLVKADNDHPFLCGILDEAYVIDGTLTPRQIWQLIESNTLAPRARRTLSCPPRTPRSFVTRETK